MKQEKQDYKSMSSSFYQEKLGYIMDVDLIYYSNDDANYEVSIYDIRGRGHIYKGNLRETIELILLGKLYKEQLEAQAKQPTQNRYNGYPPDCKSGIITPTPELCAACTFESRYMCNCPINIKRPVA